MCGRSCLTLSPHEIRHACVYKSPADPVYPKLPEFRAEYNCGRKYQPSFNVAPTDVTPVIVSSAHFDPDAETGDRCLVPMMWGMIPFWHVGPYQKHGLTTNNCRLETMLTSRMYGASFRKGQRCVIVCEGFYEWQTTKGAKAPDREAYYFYMPQDKRKPSDGDVDLKVEESTDSKNYNLLKIAGLFDVWSDENGDNIYSYSVITFESVANFAWLHHRSPAVLETDQQVADWLDFKRVPEPAAIACLRPATVLEWHRVSNLVNNSRNKSSDCNKPMASKETPQKPRPNALTAWLGMKRKRNPEDDDDVAENDEKK